jgi:hypothetical protein
MNKMAIAAGSINKDMQFTYNVILWHLPVTIVAVEKQ